MSNEEDSYIEKRQDERVTTRIKVTFSRLSEAKVREDLESGYYGDVFVGKDLQEDDSDSAMDAFSQNVSISGLRLIGDIRLTGGEPLTDGMALSVILHIDDAPNPIHTLARVVWSTPIKDGVFEAGLFFEGIHRVDVDRVARFILLQKKAATGR